MPNDYFNVEAMNPATSQSWQPSGAPAGLDYYNRKEQYDKMVGLKKLMMEMDLEKQQGTLEDWQKARPSALASTIATNEGEAATIGRKKEGEALSTKAKGDYDFSTLNSRIDDLIDSNDEKKRDRGIKAITHGLQVIDLMGPAVETGDKDLVRSIAKGAKVKDNNPMIEHILNSENPTATLAKWRENLEQAQARSEAGQTKLKGEYGLKEREIMASASDFSAYLHYLAAQFRTGDQKAKEKMEGLFARTTQAWFDETDPKKKAELLEKVNVLQKMVFGMKAAGAPYGPSEFRSDVISGQTPNAPGAPSRRVEAFPQIPQLGGQQAGPQPGTKLNVDGEEVEIIAINPDGSMKVKNAAGRTGTYRP